MPKKKPKKPSPTQFAKSSSVILPVEAEVNGTSDAAGSSKKLATADARDDSLGSQLAIPKVILPVQNELAQQSMLGTGTDKVRGESSGTAGYLWSGIPRSASATSRSSQSENLVSMSLTFKWSVTRRNFQV
ncbi:BnaAnng13310D [Brassica napus]|uniref:BnaAnng13310D protein n=1 Tax=Brassica napus TaxID=3708 RepID=A0A078IZ68_BRANA|nr:BnaAnng13310D [Brassica napus]